MCLYFDEIAQTPKKCGAPRRYPHTALDSRYAAKQSFSSGEKVHYSCAEDFSPSAGVRAVQCSGGRWTKLTLKCESTSLARASPLQK